MEFTNFSFNLGDDNYSLSTEIDEDQQADSRLDYRVYATQTGPNRKRLIELNATIDFNEAFLRIHSGEEQYRTVPLQVMDSDSEDGTLADAIIEIIDDIPLGDPLLCLAKAGLGSVASEALKCKRHGSQKIRDIIKCLRARLRDLTAGMLVRLAKCLLF